MWKGKKCKCRISGVREKNEIERKVPEKKIKVFWWKFCQVRVHWLGFMLVCELNLREKNDENFQSIFLVGV